MSGVPSWQWFWVTMWHLDNRAQVPRVLQFSEYCFFQRPGPLLLYLSGFITHHSLWSLGAIANTNGVVLVPSNKASEAIAAYFFSWKVMSTEEDVVSRKCCPPTGQMQTHCRDWSWRTNMMMLPQLRLRLCLGDGVSVMPLHTVFTADSGSKRQLMVPDIVKKTNKKCFDWLVRELRSSY